MTAAGTSIPAGAAGGIPAIPGSRIPPFPRRRSAAVAARRAQAQRGGRSRWQVWYERARWYVSKWFRQMLGVLTHPEDAFWELKRTGDWASVPFMLSCAVLARMGVMGFMGFHYVFQGVEKTKWNFERVMDQISRTLTLGMASFLYNGNPEDTSIVQEGVRILIPFVTWCLAHYAIAMIFYGEGGLKDIAIAGAFSLSPFILFSWPASLILTNATTLSEKALYFSISWIVNLWIVYLFWIHIRVIHDFTAVRTLATYVLGLVTVLIIWALLALVYALTSNTYAFFYEVFYEMTTR
jgi:hypothetical protein